MNSHRTYRIWHEQAKRDLPRRLYASLRSAHVHAWILAHEQQPRTVLTIYNTETGRSHGHYTTRVGSVSYDKPWPQAEERS